MSLSARLYEAVTRRTSSRPLALARIAVGGAALLKAAITLPALRSLADPATLRVPVTGWMPAVPGAGLALLVIVWLASASAFVLGWRTRAAGAVLTAVLIGVLLLDQQLYSNHLYLLCILTALLTLADSGASVSMDARARGARRDVPAWPAALLKLQISIVYGYAALMKLNEVYLSGAVLNAHLGRGTLLSVPDALRRVEVMSPLAVGSVLAEAFLALALWSPRPRRAALVLGPGFHAAIVLGIAPSLELLVFALLMLGVYPLFFDSPGSGARP